MSCIGIIGGVGPYAGLDLARKIFDNTVASRDQDHLSVSLLSFPSRIADRTEFLVGKVNDNPAEAFYEILRSLEATGATVAAIPCNTAHAAPIFGRLREKLREAASRLRMVHMIEETVAHLRTTHPGIRRVAPISTLGTWKLRVYLDALAAGGLEPIDPGEALQTQIHQAIYDLQWGIKACSSPVNPRARGVIADSIESLCQSGAEAVVLGCTELPLAVPEATLHGVPLVDPTSILARALVREVAPEKLRPLTAAAAN